MRKISGWLSCLSALSLLVVFAVGCAQQTPEERVAALRSRYTAQLQGFVVRSEPVAGEDEMAAGEEAGEEAVGEEAAAGEEGGEEIAAVPLKQDVVLDILIRNDNNEKLPGLTLDVSQVDAAKVEKGHWKIWVDSKGIGRGPGTSITYLLKDVDHQEGDGYAVEVRSTVPPEERGEYREFAAAP